MSDETGRILTGVQRTLDELRSLFILANQDVLEKQKAKLLPKGSIKERIYILCDGTRTTSDIAKEIGKDDAYVRSYISMLRKEGLIRSSDRDGRLIHEQII